MTGTSAQVNVSEVLSDALGVYRLLLPRSVIVAGSIFAVVALGDALAAKHSTNLTSLVSLLLGLVG